jgi:hypothetical protein
MNYNVNDPEERRSSLDGREEGAVKYAKDTEGKPN